MTYAVLQHRALDLAAGALLQNVDIRVRRERPGLPLVQLYADSDGDTGLDNPTTGGFFSDGKIRAYCAAGFYRVELLVDAVVVDTFYDVAVGTAAGTDSDDTENVDLGGPLTVVRADTTVYVRDRWSADYDKVERFYLGADDGIYTGPQTVGPYQVKLIGTNELPGATVAAFNASTDIIATPADDIGPVYINSQPLGGNHGYPSKILTAAAHGKTNVDIGSKWTDGAAKVWVLVRIVDVNRVAFADLPLGTATSWTCYTVMTGSTLTHSLGATHTGTITITATEETQLWPWIQDQTTRVIIDGETEIVDAGTYYASRIDVSTYYGIPNARSVFDYLIAHVGSSADPVYNDSSIQTQVEVDVTYTFRPGEMMTWAYSTNNIQAWTAGHIVGMQATSIEVGADKLFLFIPRSTTEATTSLDYSTPRDITATGFGFDLGTAEWSDANDPPERFAYIRRTSGGTPVRGFLQGLSHLVGEGVPATRAADVDVAFQHSSGGKMYPRMVNSHKAATFSAGDFFKVVGYRGYFDGSAETNAVSQGIYTWNDKRYWVLDTKSTLSRVWVKPPYGVHTALMGLPISISGSGKKSSSLTLHSEFIADEGVLISTSAGGGWMIAVIGGEDLLAGGLPIGSITGLGTGVPAALAINVGSAGSPVVQNGANAGTATNAVNIGITNDTSTNANFYPVLASANSGNVAAKVNSSKFVFNPALSSLGLGVSSAPTDAILQVVGGGSTLAGSTQYAMNFQPVFSSAATSTGNGFYCAPSTVAASFTMVEMRGIYIDNGSKGAGSTITTQKALVINTPNLGATNYSIYSAGARNYFGGGLALGADSDPGAGHLTMTGGTQLYSGTAVPAGGTAGAGLKMSSTTNLGVFFGSGAPSLSAAKGSLYLRTDGSTTNDRMYVNTNGSTTWTAVTTAA